MNINRIHQHLETLATFTTTPGAGCTRLSYTPEYRSACDYVAQSARRLGMTVHYDAVGNLRARLPGTEPDAPCIMVGSHLDTVISGGNFDGILGVVSGLEVIQSLVESGRQLKRPIELVIFAEEEGTRFRCPLAGSKALTGQFSVEDLKTTQDEQGNSWYDTLREFGLKPEQLAQDQLRPGEVAAMLELHIEQGAVLESEGLPVGVVEHIAGSENHRVRVYGRANHAGTTPMHLRKDALAGAADMISAIETFALAGEHPHTVATVGRIHCRPNAVNVIPAQVEFSIDVREIDDGRLSGAALALRELIASIAERRGVEWDMELTGRSQPRPMAPRIVDQLASLAIEAGIPHRRMISGALHDAAMMTLATDVGMIFVPSLAGRSHTPKEWTELDDIEKGAKLLLAAVLALAEQD